MHWFRWLAVLVVSLRLGVTTLAGDEEGDEKPRQGGVISSTNAYRFEVVFERTGFRVYPRTKDGKPIDASGLSGTATFFHPNSPKPWFRREIGRGNVSAAGRPTSLALAIGLGSVPETGAKATFKITGLPNPAEPVAEFSTPVRFTAPATLTFSAATKGDEKAIVGQRICPVSGEQLGSMGVPIKATRGSSSSFLCCRGCIARVKDDPDRYLSPKADSSKGAATPRR